MRRRGSGRGESVVGVIAPPKDWFKNKLKFDFKGAEFIWNEGAEPVEEFNLQSHFQVGIRGVCPPRHSLFNRHILNERCFGARIS
jgi:hypothetical protein